MRGHRRRRPSSSSPFGVSSKLALLIAAAPIGTALAADSTEYEVVRAATPIEIDGRATEAAWHGARAIEDFAAPWEGRTDRHLNRTGARLLWDDEYLYFFAEMEDEEIVVASSRDDDPLWLGDVFELFFKPDDEARSYYEFQVNPSNARLDMFLPRRAADAYQRWRKSRSFAWRTAVRQSARGWTAEGRIPWSDLAATGGRPRAGDTWRFALCRYDYRVYREPVLSSNAAFTRPDFHRWEEWRELRFAGK